MPAEHLIPLLRKDVPSKIVLLVMDGLGDIPTEPGGLTPLEAAHTPHLDRLAAEGALGRTIPVRPGVTPGSGPAHLAMFGYDPLTYLVGRGVMEALGIGMQVGAGDVAVRGNFCTLDAAGNIIDRRAGRISSEEAAPIIELLQGVQVPGMTAEVQMVKEYRFALVLRGVGLQGDIEDTDPQVTGQPPLPAVARSQGSQKTAELVNAWIAAAHQALADQPKANGITLRGFGGDPRLPQYTDAYGLRGACVAVYPMYKGVSQLVGMDVIKFSGESPADEFAAAQNVWGDYDFFFIHIKKTDSMGEDGNYDGKLKVIESVDAALPALLELKPDVLLVTGDHSTPVPMRAHSWHPVPLLLWSTQNALPDAQTQFGERACGLGGLGTIPATDIMPLALAHAGRLEKFGA
ncbi:MAG: 2,3-bisphosphoglycerate-independent phosphoglycerate mutase [Anaerolineales bacterium]|nr:2,3-bisphosphoglycerate-independent phosphoglycerate mutase [Anaerolineales bacterium]MCW5856168.1 2,3-bisphosphoglycerate-independent phosphoglycerate mutase [Anaerolineales bacterium]